MKRSFSLFHASAALALLLFTGCSQNKPAEPAADTTAAAVPVVAEKPSFGGYASQVEWGKHIVTIAGCNDCHTPKKMTPMGPVDDTTLTLSGHIEKIPPPQVDRKQMESKGYVVTADFTAWVGPWGISYTANLTPDETGTGKWTEDQFLYALKNSTFKGLAGSRPLLPPMSMMPVKFMSDDELKAIFAYTRTIKPVRNIVPAPTPPILVRKQ